MTATADFPWEPPLRGTEVEALIGALDRQRITFRYKADDLDAAGLRHTIASSTLSLGSLLKHLALVESFYAQYKLAGESPGKPWEDVDWDANPGFDFQLTDDDDPATLYRLYDDAVTRAQQVYRERIADGGLDQEVHVRDDERGPASLRRLLFDLLEEYGRHTGHADLLREAVDGRTGEDPPARWTAVSGTGVGLS
jgi:hypothetical protein